MKSTARHRPFGVAPADELTASSRAVIYKRVLERIEALPAPDRRRVMEHVDADLARKVREAGRLSWFDWRVNAHFDRAILMGLGHEGALRFWRSYGIYVATDGVFAKTVEGAVRLFGLSPAVLVRRYPDGYNFATRRQGRVTATAGSNDMEVAVYFDALPEDVATPGFIVAQQGALCALLELCGATGEVEVDDQYAQEGNLVYRVRWVVREGRTDPAHARPNRPEKSSAGAGGPGAGPKAGAPPRPKWPRGG